MSMMRLSELVKVLDAELIGGDIAFDSVGSDSRLIVPHQLFVAIKGDHFDGNQYAAQAIEKGAAAALISDVSQAGSVKCGLLVKDTRLALGLLAQYWREKFNIPVIAITGSNGKTTVKEMTVAILTVATGNAAHTLATVGNLNNDIGMPLTLLKLHKTHQYAVVEMGMNHTGEINYLTRLAKPNIALVNNAGVAHIGELGSKQAIAEAKGEIFAGLNHEGIAIVNADDAYAEYWKSLNAHRKVIRFGLTANADVSATIEPQGDITKVQLITSKGRIDFSLALLGEHNVRNALAASAIAISLGVNLDNVARGLQNFTGVKSRLCRLVGINDCKVIDDTYNASPDSMRAAIDVLAMQSGTKIMVMGDMAELGVDEKSLHMDMGAYAKKSGVNALYTLGDFSVEAAKVFGEGARSFANVDDLINYLKPQMNHKVAVLVKGSRFMKMERVVNLIIKHPILEEAH